MPRHAVADTPTRDLNIRTDIKEATIINELQRRTNTARQALANRNYTIEHLLKTRASLLQPEPRRDKLDAIIFAVLAKTINKKLTPCTANNQLRNTQPPEEWSITSNHITTSATPRITIAVLYPDVKQNETRTVTLRITLGNGTRYDNPHWNTFIVTAHQAGLHTGNQNTSPVDKQLSIYQALHVTHTVDHQIETGTETYPKYLDIGDAIVTDKTPNNDALIIGFKKYKIAAVSSQATQNIWFERNHTRSRLIETVARVENQEFGGAYTFAVAMLTFAMIDFMVEDKNECCDFIQRHNSFFKR
jgi:hypothetical protein